MCIRVTVNIASRTLSGSVSIDIKSIDMLPDDHLANIVSSQDGFIRRNTQSDGGDQITVSQEMRSAKENSR